MNEHVPEVQGVIEQHEPGHRFQPSWQRGALEQTPSPGLHSIRKRFHERPLGDMNCNGRKRRDGEIARVTTGRRLDRRAQRPLSFDPPQQCERRQHGQRAEVRTDPHDDHELDGNTSTAGERLSLSGTAVALLYSAE